MFFHISMHDQTTLQLNTYQGLTMKNTRTLPYIIDRGEEN
ncbi:hypothetical protein BH10BAC6_BH10BAC6_09390 [soil metagenome]